MSYYLRFGRHTTGAFIMGLIITLCSCLGQPPKKKPVTIKVKKPVAAKAKAPIPVPNDNNNLSTSELQLVNEKVDDTIQEIVRLIDEYEEQREELCSNPDDQSVSCAIFKIGMIAAANSEAIVTSWETLNMSTEHLQDLDTKTEELKTELATSIERHGSLRKAFEENQALVDSINNAYQVADTALIEHINRITGGSELSIAEIEDKIYDIMQEIDIAEDIVASTAENTKDIIDLESKLSDIQGKVGEIQLKMANNTYSDSEVDQLVEDLRGEIHGTFNSQINQLSERTIQIESKVELLEANLDALYEAIENVPVLTYPCPDNSQVILIRKGTTLLRVLNQVLSPLKENVVYTLGPRGNKCRFHLLPGGEIVPK